MVPLQATPLYASNADFTFQGEYEATRLAGKLQQGVLPSNPLVCKAVLS